jgi:hypothetical protein
LYNLQTFAQLLTVIWIIGTLNSRDAHNTDLYKSRRMKVVISTIILFSIKFVNVVIWLKFKNKIFVK